MKKTAVVYWSSTGNTEAMAQAVLEGMKEAGAEAVLLTPDAVDVGALAGMDAIAFGCPAMGSEVLEECEFEPMFSGEAGTQLVCERGICRGAPDDTVLEAGRAMGKALAE